MDTSEHRYASDANAATGEPPRLPVLDLEALIVQLRTGHLPGLALPVEGRGSWKVVSVRGLLPVPLPSSDAMHMNAEEEKKKEEEPAPQSPVKPGGPRVEVVYEWQDC